MLMAPDAVAHSPGHRPRDDQLEGLVIVENPHPGWFQQDAEE